MDPLPDSGSDVVNWSRSEDPVEPPDPEVPATADVEVDHSGHQTIHWHSLSDAIVFTLVIAGPTMLWEEMWRGQPMIDQKGNLWMVPAVIVTATYFIGGAIAGRHRRRPWGALVQGVALAIPTTLILVIADLARRLVLRKNIPIGVVGLWIAAIAGAAVIAVLGALFGRWLYRMRQERLSLTRHG